MVYLTYPFLVVYNLFMTLVAVIIAPILPAFAIQQDGWLDNQSMWGRGPRLPKWLNLFMTPDNSLDGDAAFDRINGRSYLAKVKWLWRNPAYSVCLRFIDTIANKPKLTGDDSIRDNDNAKAGWCFVRCGGLFQFTWIKSIGYSRCIYVVIGWNIRGTLHQPPSTNYQATFAFSLRISGFR